MGYPSKGPRKSRNDFSRYMALSSMELGNCDDSDFAQGGSPHESQRTSHRSKVRSPRLICRAPDLPCEDLHSFLPWSLFVNLGQRLTRPSFPVGKGSCISSSLKPFLGIMFSTDIGISESVSNLPAGFGAAWQSLANKEHVHLAIQEPFNKHVTWTPFFRALSNKGGRGKRWRESVDISLPSISNQRCFLPQTLRLRYAWLVQENFLSHTKSHIRLWGREGGASGGEAGAHNILGRNGRKILSYGGLLNWLIYWKLCYFISTLKG